MDTGAKILLVDDEPAFCQLAQIWLEGSGYQVKTAADLASAKACLASFDADLILLDLAMPPHFDPHQTLAAIPDLISRPVIVITGNAERDLALKAIENGAWDFIAKPLDPEMLAIVVKRALTKHGLDKEVRNLKQLKLDGQVKSAAESYIGVSTSAINIRALIERIAPTEVRVLVTGPSGTGKEVVSKAIHDMSLRKDKAFISVHCGAIPADLLESELFGYQKGAFTGADKDKVGLLSLADGGTLFLDEIGEMPAPMQIKLLRVLQEGTFFPVGGRVQQSIDVRVVSATNADLMEKVKEGEFREDLYYRIKGITLETQALDQHREDIPLLMQTFLAQKDTTHTDLKTGSQLSPEALTWFVAQTWPGNVRELKNALESVASIAQNTEIKMEDIALLFPMGQTESAPVSNPLISLDTSLDEQVKQLEIALIKLALQESLGNRSQAARQLGISRQGLLKKIERYQLG
ncbi:response regulator [Marinomonas sp. S3726]|uniref:sigma-54-dependent transcriptional regulator n=1 Tax=Marinomonas sp. S3726 TaxID=579484 RepID=UPI0005F9AE0D|nr:sigma-54 dependent transcriptional regulator [Marinomonas sp. S3726]KJZ14591.1 response regulator [Marinomonas sp. S3726]